MQGVTRALAMHTGRHFVCVCSRIHACENKGHLELFSDCTHAFTFNSLVGGILMISTSETVRGVMLDVCGSGGSWSIGGW